MFSAIAGPPSGRSGVDSATTPGCHDATQYPRAVTLAMALSMSARIGFQVALR